MQNAKDTFFITVRDRLAALNPDRVVTLRGAVRPAVLVLENELVEAAGDPPDTFVLMWTTCTTDPTEALPLDAVTCTIRYATAGTAINAGMDRGRVLAAMDAELRSVLEPYSTPKQNFRTTPATTMCTNVFWSLPELGAETFSNNRTMRTATVQVFAWREAGEA